MSNRKIQSALISVFYKDGLEEIVTTLHDLKVKIYSTGGTFSFIEKLGIPVESVESLTAYPSILGGRVKTLHPAVFGGILARRGNPEDERHIAEYTIPLIDLVIVDLYPFEDTVRKSNDDEEIIEKIDIGGISLIRAGAKNYNDVLVVSGRDQYPDLLSLLKTGRGVTTLEERKSYAASAFSVSSGYDTAIFKYFTGGAETGCFRESLDGSYPLRYGENPHQKGVYYGDPGQVFEKLHGKEISYNNFLDIDAAISLIDEFDDITFAIIKHNNACGVASRKNQADAWSDALACDPVSAYGGVIAVNTIVDSTSASEIDKVFFEIIIAPGFTDDALKTLMHKKNRIILRRGKSQSFNSSFRSVLNGVLWQEKDSRTESAEDMKTVTPRLPEPEEIADLAFANKIVKHSKSNSIVLAKNRQLLASGVGQTSRVDALKQAIQKALAFKFDLNGAVMASDAYFPFADSVEIAHKAGITAVIQPGGSVRDQETIDYCSGNGIAMVFTGIRHFKH
ncbi:MAG: bifunctional phosphoribosylaminoimidazolecarboxamide formyltransferase/IMP cyclohydrolase [Bacteroidales bacterium]|jgi:phosphoribosylaminoimidazolecarboxamide formyltransferase/IMP cyclohydrolase|nr:bifunctional phosphoribosylaminoimidazolecarboxamide formyltransferase/IMP cyclohydrolase [Bacteroidales bacterium]